MFLFACSNKPNNTVESKLKNTVGSSYGVKKVMYGAPPHIDDDYVADFNCTDFSLRLVGDVTSDSYRKRILDYSYKDNLSDDQKLKSGRWYSIAEYMGDDGPVSSPGLLFRYVLAFESKDIDYDLDSLCGSGAYERFIDEMTQIRNKQWVDKALTGNYLLFEKGTGYRYIAHRVNKEVYGLVKCASPNPGAVIWNDRNGLSWHGNKSWKPGEWITKNEVQSFLNSPDNEYGVTYEMISDIKYCSSSVFQQKSFSEMLADVELPEVLSIGSLQVEALGKILQRGKFKCRVVSL